MSTTAIVAEILIIGFQTSIWFSMMIITIFGYEWIDLSKVKGWETFIVLIAVGIFYTLGVIIDRLTDSLFHPWDLLLRKKYMRGTDITLAKMRLSIMSKNEKITNFLEYLRSRIRIARSSGVNFFLITLVLSIFILIRYTGSEGGAKLEYMLFIGTVGVFLVFFSILAWTRITKTYYKRISQGYEILFNPKSKDKNNA
jgi:hypothetical protein